MVKATSGLLAKFKGAPKPQAGAKPQNY
jgi:hypothetical protein